MAATRTKSRPKRPRTSGAATTPVSSIMSREVITVRSGTSLESVAELMLSRDLSRVPVVDYEQHLLGMVSKTDLVRQTHDAADTQEEPPRGEQMRGFQLHAKGASVDEVMSRSVMAVGETASVQRAAELMAAAHVHGLPVVTVSGRLVGFVSSMDVLGWLAGLR